MENKRSVSLLTLIIVFLSAIAALTGIFSAGGLGSYEYESILGQYIIPVVFIIPAIALTSIPMAILVLNSIQS